MTNALLGPMDPLVLSPAAEPRGSSSVGDELFLVMLFLRFEMDSASPVGAAPLETEPFGVETQIDRTGFYSGPAVPRVL